VSDLSFSFIVIGKNEGWKLSKCLDSINHAIEIAELKNTELIYVDSKSSDDSVERALKKPGIRVFCVTGKCNAAIGRKIGGNEAKGDVLVFLDGDMELQSDFLPEVISLYSKGVRFISGQIIEYFYDENWKKIGERKVFADHKLNKYDLTNGGAFVIAADQWKLVNGMRTKYVRSEDIDITYRLIQKGYYVFRSKELFVIHHTIQYDYNTTVINEISNFRNYLFRGLLIRDHLFNYKIIKRVIRINYTLLFLLFSTILSVVFSNFLFLLIYLVLIGLRSYLHYQKIKTVVNTGYLLSLFKYIFIDISGTIGIFFFFPKNISVDYIEQKTE